MSKAIFTRLMIIFFLMTASIADAQPAAKTARVGYLSGSGAEAPTIVAFRRGLRELGYIDGKNIVIEYRDTGVTQDRIPSLIAELIQLKVDVLVVTTLAAIRAAKQATKTIPIVMVTTEDPVASGLIDSLARPGANLTGLTLLTRELSAKRIELLKEIVPKISRVGYLLPESPDARLRFKEYEAAAHPFKLKLQPLVLDRQTPDFTAAFRAAAKARLNALITARNALVIVNRKQIAELAIKSRLPSMSERDDMVEAGGLVSYGTNEPENYRRAAALMDKVLRGTKPANIPVEQPMKFEFVINLKTANQLGITIPQWTLMKADRVIR